MTHSCGVHPQVITLGSAKASFNFVYQIQELLLLKYAYMSLKNGAIYISISKHLKIRRSRTKLFKGERRSINALCLLARSQFETGKQRIKTVSICN